jgi:D-3-phosphoglycerate dehydrogenase / 2-oxoglutarate reductase
VRIAILDDYQDAVRKLNCFSLLEGHEVKIFNNTVKGVGQLSVRLRDIEAIVLIRERTAISRQLLEKLPQLRLISQTGKIGDHIDLNACTGRGVAVAQGTGDPTSTAELAFGLILAAQRRLPQYITSLKHGAWQQSGLRAGGMPQNFGLGRVLKGSTLGIWGFGRIGTLVAGFGHAFGMKVLIWGSEAACARAKEAGYEAAPNRAALFEQSDVLSLHLRLSEATHHAVTLEDLSRMKPQALFVNTSRAELLASDALVAALNRGRPGFAAVDVFESEPILQGHPLLRMENALTTPHIGFVERNSYEMYFEDAFRNIIAFDQRAPINIVNEEALKVVRR